MKEPTSEECSANATITVTLHGKDRVMTACWYPQMGGYCAKCLIDPHDNGCFDAYIWHDGEFPFNEADGRNPALLHHSDAEQFIEFGKLAEGLTCTTS